MTASQQVASADVSHLSQDALTRLRGVLVAESTTQALQSDQHEAVASELRGHVDPDSILERELAEAGAARAREAVSDIEYALSRLDAGTYGRCEECGRPIPFQRLEAIPSACVCVACPDRGARRRVSAVSR